jgi:hypothetical protein
MFRRRQPNREGLVIVATASGILRAQVLKAKLDEAGIDSLLVYESASLLFGITAGGLALSEVQIFVPHEQAEDARQLLSAKPPPGWEADATEYLDES